MRWQRESDGDAAAAAVMASAATCRNCCYVAVVQGKGPRLWQLTPLSLDNR